MKKGVVLYEKINRLSIYTSSIKNNIISDKELISILKYFNINKDKVDKCVRGFAKLSKEYTEQQLQLIIRKLPLDVRIILEDNSKEYLKIAKTSVKNQQDIESKNKFVSRDLERETGMSGSDVIIPNQVDRNNVFKKIKRQK